jgi:hypothetical protein
MLQAPLTAGIALTPSHSMHLMCEMFPSSVLLYIHIYSQTDGSAAPHVSVMAAIEAFERHRNPPKSLTNTFNHALYISEQVYHSGKFKNVLTSIADQALDGCRLLLLCATPEGHVLPSQPNEQDYRNASILINGLPVLST